MPSTSIWRITIDAPQSAPQRLEAHASRRASPRGHFARAGQIKTAIAALLGVSRQTLYDVLNEKQPVTANLAVRLGKLCGDGPDIWLRLQQVYDRELAERELKDVIAKIPTLHAAE